MLTVTTVNIDRMGSEARAGFERWLRSPASDAVCVQGSGGERGRSVHEVARQAGWHLASSGAHDGSDGVSVYTGEAPETWHAGFDAGGGQDSDRYVEVTLKDVVIGSVHLPPGDLDPTDPEARAHFLQTLAVYLGELRARAEAGSKDVLLCGPGNLLDHRDDAAQRAHPSIQQQRTRLARNLLDEGYADVVGAVGLPDSTGEPRFPNYQVATAALVERARAAWTEAFSEHAETWSEGAAVSVNYDL